MKKIKITLGILADYIRYVLIGKRIMVGMGALVKWSEPEVNPDPMNYYLSFSADPVEEEWDDYGVRDDEVFYYLDGVKEAIRFVWIEHEDGWQILDGRIMTTHLEQD